MEGLPKSVEGLIGRLSSAGFILLGDETNESHFGDRLITFARPPIELRVVRDRGQWAIDLKADGWSDWVGLPIFEGALPPLDR